MKSPDIPIPHVSKAPNTYELTHTKEGCTKEGWRNRVFRFELWDSSGDITVAWPFSYGYEKTVLNVEGGEHGQVGENVKRTYILRNGCAPREVFYVKASVEQIDTLLGLKPATPNLFR